jgi:hypothetical protein
VALVFVHALSLTWRKWGSLIIDGGRELELPARLVEGGTLYGTVRNIYGPLPAWTNATLYRLFGIHLDVLVAAGIVTAAVMASALYALARRYLGTWTSAAVAAAFVWTSAFAHLLPNASFNFILPYSFAATYGITAATLSLLFAVRHVQTGSHRDLIASLSLAVVTALCKLEPTMAVALAHAALLAGGAAAGIVTRRTVLAYVAAVAALAAVYVPLQLRVGTALWWDNILSPATSPLGRYTADTMGLLDLPGAGRATLLSLVLAAAAAGAGAGAAWVAARWPTRGHLAWSAGAAAALAVGAAAFRTPLDLSLRALPMLAAAILGGLALRFVREEAERRVLLAHAVLWAFVLGCLSRLLLNVTPYQYGFYLTPVPLLALTVVTSGGMNRALGLRPWPRASTLPAVGLLLGVTLACVTASREQYAEHRVELSTPRGRLLVRTDDYAPQAVRLLETLPASARVIAIPHGAGFVFMSGRRWADGTFAYAPPDLVGTYDDASLVRRWRAAPPDAFVYFQMPHLDFGKGEFGSDYARHAGAWLMSHYALRSDPRGPVFLFLPRATAAADPPP